MFGFARSVKTNVKFDSVKFDSFISVEHLYMQTFQIDERLLSSSAACLSGPEWLVRRVDRCVEIGERFLYDFIYTLFTTMYSTESMVTVPSTTHVLTHTITRHVLSSPVLRRVSLRVSECVWQAQPACLYLQFLPDVYIALTVARRTGHPSDKSTVTLTERKNPWRRADRS